MAFEEITDPVPIRLKQKYATRKPFGKRKAPATTGRKGEGHKRKGRKACRGFVAPGGIARKHARV